MTDSTPSRPAHHVPGGRFRNPWPEAAEDEVIRRTAGRMMREWLTTSLPPNPTPEALPSVRSDIADPTTAAGELRVTWVGHATHLVQLPGLNLLTDPMWSERASPWSWSGPKRFVTATPALDTLPPIHGVLLSHDHYDHLDRRTVVRLRDRFGPDLPWYTPLAYRSWFTSAGVRDVVELDWWQEHALPGGERLVALPARHWTRRTPWSTNTRLWCSWAILTRDPTTPRVFWGGDTAYASHFREIGQRLGPFDACILPIGAYEPRWFMGASHMNPEEAVTAYQDLGGSGAFLPSHWGTFRLTFEDPLEPPERIRAAWGARGLDQRWLHVPRHGETVVLRRA